MEFTEEELASEEWRPVVGYEGLYEVSSEGNLRRLARVTQCNKFLSRNRTARYVSTKPRGDGHVVVNLNNNGKYKRFALSHIVAAAFLPEYDGRSRVAHIDGNKGNNRVCNLAITKNGAVSDMFAAITDEHDLPNEEWRPVKEYEGLYEVSSLGRVRRVNKHGAHTYVLRQVIRPNGYLYVHLSKDGVARSVSVHRLVAEGFINNDTNLPMVNHKDEVKTNNTVDNLEWASAKYNTSYGSTIARRVASHDYSSQGLKQRKPIIQQDLDGNIIKIWPSVKEIHEGLGYSISAIRGACARKGSRSSQLGITHGCRWSYEEDYDDKAS